MSGRDARSSSNITVGDQNETCIKGHLLPSPFRYRKYWIGHLCPCAGCSSAKPRRRPVAPTAVASKSAAEAVGTTESVSGFVYSGDEPIAGARVRVQTTDNLTLSGVDGSFTLSDLTAGETITVTAWASGFYNGWAQAVAGDESVVITLTSYHQTDNHLYDWFEHEGEEGLCRLRFLPSVVQGMAGRRPLQRSDQLSLFDHVCRHRCARQQEPGAGKDQPGHSAAR